MTGLAIIFVLCSAAMHAAWNVLAKRATAPEVFTVWMAAAAVAVFAPVAGYLLVVDPPNLTGWAFIAGTIVLHTGYFTFLGRAYRDGDLSMVYPLARGSGIALVPAVAYFVLGETLSWQAAVGVALVVAGIFGVSGSIFGRSSSRASFVRSLAQPGLVFALLTGVMICGYSVLDKEGVKHVSPLLYVTLLTAGGGLGMYLIIRKRYAPEAFAAEVRARWRTVVVAGFLQTAAYGLVLAALKVSPVSYVAPFREVGIVIGVGLSAVVLRERVPRWRVLSAATVAVGAIVIAAAP